LNYNGCFIYEKTSPKNEDLIIEHKENVFHLRLLVVEEESPIYLTLWGLGFIFSILGSRWPSHHPKEDLTKFY
jgi:hypothetical protein